jgi:hypothetical protein
MVRTLAARTGVRGAATLTDSLSHTESRFPAIRHASARATFGTGKQRIDACEAAPDSRMSDSDRPGQRTDVSLEGAQEGISAERGTAGTWLGSSDLITGAIGVDRVLYCVILPKTRSNVALSSNEPGFRASGGFLRWAAMASFSLVIIPMDSSATRCAGECGPCRSLRAWRASASTQKTQQAALGDVPPNCDRPSVQRGPRPSHLMAIIVGACQRDSLHHARAGQDHRLSY